MFQQKCPIFGRQDKKLFQQQPHQAINNRFYKQLSTQCLRKEFQESKGRFDKFDLIPINCWQDLCNICLFCKRLFDKTITLRNFIDSFSVKFELILTAAIISGTQEASRLEQVENLLNRIHLPKKIFSVTPKIRKILRKSEFL